MADNYTLQEAPLGSPFKAKQIGGVKHPGHILYDETGAPVAVATEVTLASLRDLAHADLQQLHGDIATGLIVKNEAIRALLEPIATLAQGSGLKVALQSADGAITINVANADFAGIGTPADAPETDPAAAGSAVALLKGLLSTLSSGQKASAASLSVVLSSDGPFTTNFGGAADTAQADPTQTASLIALLKGLLSTERAIQSAAAITPSDAVPFTAGRQLFINCTTAGNVKVGWSDGSTLTVPIAAGVSILPWAVNKVFVTGTSAVATYAALK